MSVWGGARRGVSQWNCQSIMFGCYLLMLLCDEIHLTQISVCYASKRIVLLNKRIQISDNSQPAILYINMLSLPLGAPTTIGMLILKDDTIKCFEESVGSQKSF